MALENLLFCELEPGNLFNVFGNALKVGKGNGNEDQIIGTLPDSPVQKIAPLIRLLNGSLKPLKLKSRAKELLQPTEGMWV